MNRTAIEWTDWTWNPITGCLHGCPYCYARRLAEGRLKGRNGYDNGFKPTFHPSRLNEPRKIARHSKIFVSSMGDLLGDWVKPTWIQAVIETMRETPQHTYQILTKNPRRLEEFNWPQNAWFGTSWDGTPDALEERYDRVDSMLHVGLNWANAIRFISLEPLLGNPYRVEGFHLEGFDWVIVGAQTGPHAMAPSVAWVDKILSDASEQRIPVFLKDNLRMAWNIQKFPYPQCKGCEFRNPPDGCTAPIEPPYFCRSPITHREAKGE